MSAICGCAHDAEQPEKCIRITPASPRAGDAAPGAGRSWPSSAPSGDRAQRAQLDGPVLRLDDGEAAELAAGAGDHATLERPGERRVLRQQLLGQQRVDPASGTPVSTKFWSVASRIVPSP